MIKNATGSTVTSLLENLRASQQLIDLVPGLAVSAARLAHIVLEVEEWAADEILVDEANRRGKADRKGFSSLE